MEFDLLLKLKELEKETGYKIVLSNENILYFSEPNATIPFKAISIENILKENSDAISTNSSRTNTTGVERTTDIIIRRSRGIIQERSRRSRGIREGSGSIREGRKSICGINGDEIWRRDFEARVSLQELQTRSQRLEDTNRFIQQSQTYKQKALESYQQQLGASAPQSNLQRESSQLIDYESLLNTDKGFRTKETLESLIKDIAKEYKIDIEEARIGIERELQKQSQQKDSKDSISNQSKQESKKEIPKPISKTKPTKQIKEPYRGR
ncbi:hypothetical protein [Helicobacter sp. MIT 05-5294]|uniref:hypothetical protein n=1 Tax=Helicobacter sp. MIT 05-5294 TaxID=1548150 RepID=UPI00051FDFCC|nr:hypothetical protein [Helicobacter sp. MIT 05-5294]TLD85551.1 hypothetical protein LS69_008870 [Helicobacter sp. MIT 05-5294]